MSLVIKERFVTDENGRKTNVLLSLKDYQRLKRMAELFQEEDTFTKEDDCYIEGEMQAFVSGPEGERIAKRIVDLKYREIFVGVGFIRPERNKRRRFMQLP